MCVEVLMFPFTYEFLLMLTFSVELLYSIAILSLYIPFVQAVIIEDQISIILRN